MDEASIQRELDKRRRRHPPRRIQLQADSEGAAARLFLALGTQWKTAGMAGIPTGLDYSAIRPAAEALQLEMTPSLFDDLRLMEHEALAAMAEQREANR